MDLLWQWTIAANNYIALLLAAAAPQLSTGPLSEIIASITHLHTKTWENGVHAEKYWSYHLRGYQVWLISTAPLCVTVPFWCYRSGFITVQLQSKSCPWENQDENIIQMSGGFRYYDGGHRSQMDGWMCWMTVYRQLHTYSNCLLTHQTALRYFSVCFNRLCQILGNCLSLLAYHDVFLCKALC